MMSKCTNCNGKGYVKQTWKIILNIPVHIFFGLSVLIGFKMQQPGKVESPIKCNMCNGTGEN